MPKKKKKANEQSFSELWDNIKLSNILVTGVPEKGVRKEKLFEKNNRKNFQ